MAQMRGIRWERKKRTAQQRKTGDGKENYWKKEVKVQKRGEWMNVNKNRQKEQRKYKTKKIEQKIPFRVTGKRKRKKKSKLAIRNCSLGFPQQQTIHRGTSKLQTSLIFHPK